MLRRHRQEDSAGAPDRRPEEHLAAQTQGAGDESSKLARAVLERLEADRAWAEEQFGQLVERLDRVDARLERQGASDLPAKAPARPRSKEGLSRQEVLAIRATKHRARRAAELKAQREDTEISDDQGST